MLQQLKAIEAGVLGELSGRSACGEQRQGLISGCPQGRADRGRVPGRGGADSDAEQQPLKLRGGLLFFGGADSFGNPHGFGELLLADGSVHTGSFQGGAADSDGIYYDCKGSVHMGCWKANRRVGTFDVVDGNGRRWVDGYDETGKWTSRKREGEAVAAAVEEGPPVPAVACPNCSVRFHAGYNFKCRRHVGRWDGPAQGGTGRWVCCGAREEHSPGCQIVAMHTAPYA